MSLEDETALDAPLADRRSAAKASNIADRWTIAIIIPTLGRAPTTRKTIDRLARQSRAPDRVIVVGVGDADIAGLDGAAIEAEIHLAPRGSCSQRNHAISLVEGEADLLVFLDDDFLPADDFLAEAERLFRDHPDIAGACGRVIADGANGPGIAFETAEALLAEDAPSAEPLLSRRGLYGCNMVFRGAAVAGLRFDEALPLYGWQEDYDFSHWAGRRGRLVRSAALAGVHMGEKAGRSSGKRFGYSQIANPLYLLKKRSMPRERALRLMRDNLISNVILSVLPEPYVDRRGRLFGNILALFDLARGRLDPRRILELA